MSRDRSSEPSSPGGAASARSASAEREPDEAAAVEAPHLRLRLYVARGETHSSAAVRNLQRFLEDRGFAAELEVLDVFDETNRAREDRILVTPTLIRLVPAPVRRILGSLQDPDLLGGFLGEGQERT